MRASLSSLLPPILWAALVALTLLAPGDLAAEAPAWAEWFAAHGGDKLVHMALFFGQAFWLTRALPAMGAGATRAAWWAAVAAASYGLVLELAQLAVPGRGFELADLAANAAGAFLWAVVGRRPAGR